MVLRRVSPRGVEGKPNVDAPGVGKFSVGKFSVGKFSVGKFNGGKSSGSKPGDGLRSDGEPGSGRRGDGPRLLAVFRCTRRQSVGHGLFVGSVAGGPLLVSGAVVAVTRAATTGGTWPYEWLALLGLLLLPVAIGAVVGTFAGVRTGVDADDLGIHSVPPLPRSFGPWPAIADIRAERRRSKTIVAIYLESGAVLRLRAPYDGKLLGHDPRFERKYFTLLNLWETHRNRRGRI